MNLSGLSILTSIAGDIWISGNPSFDSLSGLDNVTSIEGFIKIDSNDALISLTGLDSIDAGSISDLYITDNSSLSTCEALSVCYYLSSGSGTIEIHDNAIGCNSQEEVEAACVWIGVPDMDVESMFTIFPNPAKSEINISTDDGKEIDEVSIYTLTGQRIMKDRPVNGNIDISGLQPGMYIVEVTIENIRLREKLMVR